MFNPTSFASDNFKCLSDRVGCWAAREAGGEYQCNGWPQVPGEHVHLLPATHCMGTVQGDWEISLSTLHTPHPPSLVGQTLLFGQDNIY